MDTNIITSSLWQKALSVIQTETSKESYVTLFKKTTLLSLEENTATIAAPSTMIIDLIQKKHFDLVKATLDKETGRDISVVFVPKTIVEEKPGNKTEAPLFVEHLVTPKFVGHLPRVRPDYTFQTLAVSSSNQLAYTSATTVAKHLGTSYNPLFIYGPVGVGKTHLMQAIANHVYQEDPSKKIIYITSEEFTNEVVDAIRTNQTQNMKRRFRTASLLIIDDVQFIAGKDRVQEELFHTFNILIDNGSQIVLSSDRPPNEIKKLEKRLSSRFSGGLTVDVEAPDFELKTAILLIKAKKYGIDLPIEVAKTLAESVQDTRSLEGQLLRLITQSQASNKEITQNLAVESLLHKPDEGFHFHPDDVVKKVCEFYNIKPTQIRGPKRDASLVRARQVAMYLLKTNLGLTYTEIGNLLGGRDHTTIMYGVGKMEGLVDKKAGVSEDIVGIIKNVRG
ncbi:MAG: chromosomal replication initiator protein DnaA [Patescibacteria group bacterium]